MQVLTRKILHFLAKYFKLTAFWKKNPIKTVLGVFHYQEFCNYFQFLTRDVIYLKLLVIDFMKFGEASTAESLTPSKPGYHL